VNRRPNGSQGREGRNLSGGRNGRCIGALGSLPLLFLALQTPGYAMTSEELIGSLKKMGAGEAKVLETSPVEIEEKHYDFLRSGVYLRVTVLAPHHPHLLNYVVGPGGDIYRLKLGAPELERMRADLKLEIKDPEMALRYAQWVLEVTEGPALWLLSSVKDVPFQPVAEGEEQLAKEIEKAKAVLASKISAPTAKSEKNGFAVTQDAVRERDLVRYDVTVSTRGQCDVERQTLLTDLPVVYVLED
jgi:hypothetical protein